MSLSSARTGPRRVLPNGADRGLGAGLARWEPAPPLDRDNNDPLVAARRAGYAEGYASARAEAETAVEADRGRLRTALTDAAGVVARTRVDAVTTVTAEVVELAVQLTEALLQRELATAASAELDAVSRALALTPAGEDIAVRLHPDHLIEVGDIEALASGVVVRVIADPTIEHGGCVLEVGPCRIDTQIGPAIQRARALIGAGRPGEDRP